MDKDFEIEEDEELSFRLEDEEPIEVGNIIAYILC
jgi:hypothetical protein